MHDLLIVTPYPAVAQYLKESGIVPDDTPCIDRVGPEEVRGKHVYGILPLWLASYAESVTEYVMTSRVVPLSTIDARDVPKFLRPIVRYIVTRVEV